MATICVVGVGYVGLTTGACLADLGNQVVCLDVDVDRTHNLRRGVLPIFEPGLGELVARNVAAGRLSFTTDYAEALRHAELAFIAVGTPSGSDGEADLHHVQVAAESVAARLDHPLVLVNKSTVPIGAGDQVAAIVQKHRQKHGGDDVPFWIVSNPEFLREGVSRLRFYAPRSGRPRGARSAGRRPGGPVVQATQLSDPGDRSPHGGNDQVCLQRIPGNQDLVHQRDRQHL